MSTYFLDSEWRAASQRQPTAAEWSKLDGWRAILDPGRRAYGGPVVLTSWVRLGGGAHATGDAVDLQPVRGGEEQIRALADWFASAYLDPVRGPLVQVIYEPPAPGQRRGHVHLARRLVQGATPGYLHETHDGAGRPSYTLAEAPRIVGGSLGMALLLYATARILLG